MSSRISPDLVWPGHKKIPFPFWSFILSFFIFNLSTVEFFNLMSTVQVRRSFFLPSWPATYVCPPAIFICSWSNEWCSLSFTLMSARLSFLKDTEMRQTKQKELINYIHQVAAGTHKISFPAQSMQGIVSVQYMSERYCSIFIVVLL